MTYSLRPDLTEAARSAIHLEGTIPRLTKYIPIVPTPKQSVFLLSDNVREVFYGGAAGPGKTSALLAAALQYVDIPGYAALLLRRNFKQLALPGSLIPLSHSWLDRTDAIYHEGRKEWRFPSGATLTFGFVGQQREDERKYETAQFQFIGIDELTAWPEDQYRFLFSRLRRLKGMPVPIRMRSGSNPGGRGHAWVKKRFVDPQTRNRRASFIPARLDDNPHLDRTEYIETLQELHPTHWRRILHGDWDAADPGEMFQPRMWLDDNDWLDAPPARVSLRCRYWDLAASEPGEANPDPDWTVGARMSRTREGFYVIEHLVRIRQTPAAVERLVANTTAADGEPTTQWIEQEPGASGKSLVDHFRRNVCPAGFTMRGNRPQGSKGLRARPLAAAMEQHRVKVVRGAWNDALFDEMEAFSEDVSHSGDHDDQVDACSGAFSRLRRTSQMSGTTPAGHTLASR